MGGVAASVPKAKGGRRVLLTGASGTLGRFLAPRLASRYGSLVVTDLVDFPGALPAGATFEPADLCDAAAVARLADDMDTIVHFGGVNGEKSFETVLAANIVGVTNVFEAARQARARVVFASSNHTVGFYERGEILSVTDPGRPDGLYGLSKLYGEMMGRLYFDKHGVESIHLRIGSCLARPTEPRHLSTWLSYPDLERLVFRAIEADHPGVAAVWGVSANTRSWWRGDDAARIGYVPADDAEAYAHDISAATDDEISARYQGGSFCAAGYTRNRVE